MKIKRIINQHRRDFFAVFECEHCRHSYEGSGYDDSYYHNHVVPNLVCSECGKVAEVDYAPRQPKHGDDEQI